MASAYFKVWNSAITAPDPDGYAAEPPPVVGRMGSGKPIRQGREAGTASWAYMTLAEFIDLWDRYNTNKDSSGTFVIPGRTSGQSWTVWRSVTAYAEEPTCEYRGRVCQGVSMRIVIP